MSKKAILPQRARHIMIFDEDWEFIDKIYGMKSPSKLGVSEAIRTIVHKKCQAMRARYEGQLDERAQQAMEAREDG